MPLYHNCRWAGSRHEDAHEFLVALLDQVEAEVRAAEAVALGTRRLPLSRSYCPIARNFSGRLLKRFTCKGCSKASSMTEPLMEISLELPEQQPGGWCVGV